MDECTQKWIDIAIRDHLSSESTFNLCGICNDKATGRHYGAISCDGCKGFFRRSVRNNNVYSCRFQRRCPVDKDKRNQCRYCRLRKCFVIGMKMEAVQNERDRIKPQPRGHDEQAQIPGLSVMALRQSEVLCRELAGLSDQCPADAKRRMTLKEMHALMKNQMSPLVAWAKSIPMFSAMTPIDQITLVRSFALSNLLLTAVRLSLRLENVLFFGGGWYLPGCGANGHKRKKTDDPLAQIGVVVFEELVRPLFEAQADVGDFACLKAISFFNPHAEFLVERDPVKKARSQIQVNLQDRLQDNQYDFRGRFGDLLLILGSLQGVTTRLSELMSRAGLYDLVEIEGFARNLLRMPKLVLGPVNGRTSPDGRDDSSGTLSSPNTPPFFDGDVVEQITVKCEPDEFDDDGGEDDDSS